MKREIDDRTILEDFAIRFTDVVSKYANYVIVSGFVAIAHGRSRGTEDIDIIIERITRERFILMHNDLLKADFECIQGPDSGELYDDYLKDNLSIRYVRNGTHVPDMELKLAKDELDGYQLENRKKLPMTGMELFFSGPEFNIAFKEELLKSEKDLEDSKHLRIVYEGEIDENEVDKIKAMIRKLRLGE